MRLFVSLPATCGILFFACLAPLPLAAQQKFDPAARAQAVAPYLEEDVMLVGRVDLKRLDIKAVDKTLSRLFPAARGVWDFDQPELFQRLKDQVLQAGGREVYLVLSLADVPHGGPFAVFPLAAGQDSAKLAAAMREVKPQAQMAIEPWGRAVFLGSQATLKRLKKRDAPAERAEMAKAFTAAGDAAVAVLLLPSDDHRRVVDEMMPRLPPGLGGGSTKPLTEGFRFAALGIDVAPSLSVRLVVQAKDGAAAAAQRKLTLKLLEFLSEHPQIKAIAPNLEQLAQPLLPRLVGDQLTLELNDENQGTAALLAATRPFVQHFQAAAQQQEIVYNLRKIGIAMHNYHDVNMSFPAAANYDKDGKPLLSWRVLILPYVDGLDLYKQFRLNEPWDSEHNKRLIARTPDVYRSSQGRLKLGYTTFLAPIGEKTVFSGKKGVSFRQIRDGTSNTLLVLQAPDAAAVPWTKPADWEYDPRNPLKGFFDKRDVFFAVFCDGASQAFNKDLTAETFRAILTRDGREPVR